MPTTENSRMWPQCCMVGIRLTITWQCDMVVSPVVRHSGNSAFQHETDQTYRLSDFIYRSPIPVSILKKYHRYRYYWQQYQYHGINNHDRQTDTRTLLHILFGRSHQYIKNLLDSCFITPHI